LLNVKLVVLNVTSRLSKVKDIVIITQAIGDVTKVTFILPTQCFYIFLSDLKINNNFSLNGNNRLSFIMEMEHVLFEILPEFQYCVGKCRAL